MKTLLFISLLLITTLSAAMVTSHKTAGLEYPENSLEGFLYSLELPIDAIEFDVHFTADREIVLSHDPVLDDYNCFKKGDKRKVIIAQTNLKDILALNCYNDKVKKYYRVPTLDSILEAYINSGRNDIELNFEIKVLDKLIENWSRYKGMEHKSFHLSEKEMGELALKKVRSFGIDSNILFTTFSRDLLLQVKADKKENETFRYGLLFKGFYAPFLWPVIKYMERECFDSCWWPNWKNTYKWLIKHKIDVFMPNWEQLTQSTYNGGFRKYFQKEGRPFEMYPWTLNDEAQWETYETYDFDGMVTDLPSDYLKR